MSLTAGIIKTFSPCFAILQWQGEKFTLKD